MDETIEVMWAWQSTDEAGKPAMLTVTTERGAVPLCGHSLEVLQGFRAYVEQIVRATGRRARLLRYEAVKVEDEVSDDKSTID